MLADKFKGQYKYAINAEDYQDYHRPPRPTRKKNETHFREQSTKEGQGTTTQEAYGAVPGVFNVMQETRVKLAKGADIGRIFETLTNGLCRDAIVQRHIQCNKAGPLAVT